MFILFSLSLSPSIYLACSLQRERERERDARQRSRRERLETGRSPFTTLGGKWKFFEQFARLARRLVLVHVINRRQSPEKNFAEVWLPVRRDVARRQDNRGSSFNLMDIDVGVVGLRLFLPSRPLVRAHYHARSVLSSVPPSALRTLRFSIMRRKLKLSCRCSNRPTDRVDLWWNIIVDVIEKLFN